MTIQKQTHKICKIIQKTNFRNLVKQLFDDLELKGSISSLNSIAVVLNRQFFGYLFANQTIFQHEGYSLLSPQEIEILNKAHKFLLETTKYICCLDEILPKAQAAISPYSDCQVDPSNLLVLPEFNDFETLHKAVEELKEEFRKHPGLEILRDCVNNLDGLNEVEEQKFVEKVLYFRREIINQELVEVDDELKCELFNSQEKITARLVRNLIVLHDSLSSISQFIYQAFRYEKPIVLNRDNVFYYDGESCNYFADTKFLRVQTTRSEAYLWPGDFVIVSLGQEELMEDGFYRVQNINYQDSSEFGSSSRLALQKVDENMVCYPQIFLSD